MPVTQVCALAVVLLSATCAKADEEKASPSQPQAHPVMLAAMPLQRENLEEQREQLEELRHLQRLAQEQEDGDWLRYIPTHYKHFFRSKEDEALVTVPRIHPVVSRSKTSRFLGVPQESITTEQSSLLALACLSVVGFAILIASTARANRRAINLHTEVLG